METTSKMVEKAAAFASGKSSTEAKEKVEALNKDIEAGQGSSNVNSEEGQGSGIGIQNECRICQEEDYLHKLEAPCHCNGTLKPYEAGYTMVIPPPQPSPQTENVTIPIRDGTYFMVNTQARLQAAQRTVQTEAAAEFLRRQHAMQAHGGRAFDASALCRIAAVICLTFLVMKDIYYFYESGQDSHLLTIFWCCAPNQSEGDLAVVEVTVPEVPVAGAPQYNWTAHRY
ncbi:uncharacterized protein [Pyrus communis]|uniref:uncharacterized protein n=1 Tax=Pyrus communis TaxID=23211 RepID=UPI0035C247CB